MIMIQEEALLKGREQFERLVNLVRQAPQDGQRIDTVERELMRQLLALGHTLLSLFISSFRFTVAMRVAPLTEVSAPCLQCNPWEA